MQDTATSANVASALPRADGSQRVAPNTVVVGSGLQKILPSDIPCDDDGDGTRREYQVKPRFVHRPTITRRVGTTIEVVTGPVQPVVPHTDESTAKGWKRYYDVGAKAKAAEIERAKKIADEARAYWHSRREKQEADYQAKCERAREKGRSLPKRPVKEPPPPGWEMYLKDPELVKQIIGRRHALQRKDRLRCARLSGKFADRDYAPVVEKFHHEDGTPAPALRGWLNLLSLQLFNGALEKGRNVTHGFDKTIEFSGGSDRIWALDSAYVVADKFRRTMFVVDLDGWWETLEKLRTKLRKILPPEFMPNIITYRGREEDGAGVENPHLVWLLPPGARVIGFGKKKRKLHEMVQKAIVSLLIDVGADGGHTNVDKTKNPLAIGWSIEVCDDYFQTMAAWRRFLPTINCDRSDMIKRTRLHKAQQETGAEPKESLAIWNDGITYRRLEITAAQATQDPAYLSAIRRCKPGKVVPFADWLYNPADGVVTQRLFKIHGNTKAVRSVIAAQRDWVLQLAQTPSEVGELCNRGRDAKANEDLKPLPPTATTEERKAREKLIKRRARQRTQAFRETVHSGLVAEAIEHRLSSGVPVVKAEVVRALVATGNIGRSTAYDMFDDVFQVVQQTARYQAHRSDNQPTQPSQPAELASVDEVVPGQPMRIPAKTTTAPPWIVCKDDLTLWQEVCRLRNEWSVAVAAWRSANARRRPGDGANLAADPEFRALVLDRSSWACRRRH